LRKSDRFGEVVEKDQDVRGRGQPGRVVDLSDQESGLSQLGGASFGSKTPLYYIVQAATMMILVLAVKLRELFGMADTPRVADGRVPVMLHLLSPGGRPVQVTQDLKGFWDRTYPEVKKEMKGRYPRHPWPDDPWAATPTHRAKPRGT